MKDGSLCIPHSNNNSLSQLLISDVTHVIDPARVKESRFNVSTRIKELVTVWTSKASATQRAGRAGRTSSGVCWRLYSEDFSNQEMLPQTAPEIVRTPLDELVLQVCLLYEQKRNEKQTNKKLPEGVCPIRFLRRAPEPPSDDHLADACKHLLEVGALTAAMRDKESVLYRLTPLGYHLVRLPMDPKVGKVLIVGW
jgi:HrpA-like RNA helicase